MKNSIVTITAVLCVAVLGGCLGDSGDENERETPGDTNYGQSEMEKVDLEKPELPPPDAEVEGKEPTIKNVEETPCADATDQMTCLHNLAIETGDTSYCERLITGTVVDPRGVCIKDVAIARQDVSICDKLSGDKKGLCIIFVAKEKQDAVLCDKLQDPNKDRCLREVAKSTADISLCMEINTANIKEGCIRDVNYLNAQ